MAGPENKDNLFKICQSIEGIKVIYDCGSRDALDGLELMSKLNAEELHVFECNPAAIRLCKTNINSYSGIGKIYMNELAVSDKEGELSFNSIDPEKTVTPHSDGNIGASSLFEPNQNYSKESYKTNRISVKATSLDAYHLSHHRPPDLLWIDLQGAELDALQGGISILKNIKIIHVEVTFRQIYKNQALFYQVHNFLKRDFKLYKLANIPFLERLIRSSAGNINRFINFGHWFTNAIYVNKSLSEFENVTK